MAETEFDRGKFKQLALYLAQLSADDEFFGAVKLNKLLFFCDFEAYRMLGRPISGARYQREEQGPIAPVWVRIQDEMISDGWIRIERRQRGGHDQIVTVAIHRPSLAAFTHDELQLISRVVEALRPLGASGASRLSHERSAGWQMFENGETIPYGTTFVSTSSSSEAAMARAERRAREENWAAIRP